MPQKFVCSLTSNLRRNHPRSRTSKNLFTVDTPSLRRINDHFVRQLEDGPTTHNGEVVHPSSPILNKASTYAHAAHERNLGPLLPDRSRNRQIYQYRQGWDEPPCLQRGVNRAEGRLQNHARQVQTARQTQERNGGRTVGAYRGQATWFPRKAWAPRNERDDAPVGVYILVSRYAGAHSARRATAVDEGSQYPGGGG